MRVVIIGAYGLLGGYVTARLLRDGREVMGIGRDVAAAERRFPSAEWVKADLRRMAAADWRPLLAGADAVVNCAGALQDSPRDDLDATHRRTVSDLAQACAEAGVARFVQISALGVEEAPGRFAETKRAADAALSASPLDWVILRPGLVIAPAAYGGSALLRGLAGFPGAIPALWPDAIVQTVAVEDVAEAVAWALAAPAPLRRRFDLASPEPTRLDDLLRRLRAWQGFPPAPVLAAPVWLGRLAARAADGLAWLGWRSPMRTTALRQLALGVRADASQLPPIRIRSLAEVLQACPSGAQERWFARLYFAKPLILATLALFWAVSGLLALARTDTSAAALVQGGLDPIAARALVIGGAVSDVGLAVLVAARPTASLALKGMVLLTLGYLAGSLVWAPGLWLDPLGPLVKAVPAAVLAMAALAMMDER